MTRNILVTGGAGYIGSHACKELSRWGYSPIVFDNLERGHGRAVKWGPLVIGDLANKDEIRSVIESFHIEAVVHFAAFAYIGESVQHPGLYFRNNVANTLNLLDAMTETKVRDIVFSSTCAVYGVPGVLPITEDTPVAPINPYGESKLQVERILACYEKAHGLRWSALRYFNAAGADPDGEIGENHSPETQSDSFWLCRLLLARRHPCKSSERTIQPQTGRPYATIFMLPTLPMRMSGPWPIFSAAGSSGAFNLGTGQGISVKEIVREIEAISKLRVPVIEAARRPGDPPQLVANTLRANRILGWSPKYSDVRTIVQTALRWEQNRTMTLAAE